MDQRSTTTPEPDARVARGRVASLAVAGLVFAAGMVFALGGGGSSSAAATPGLTYHGEIITLLVPTDQGDGFVRIHLLLADDGSGSFDDVVAKARADAIAGFPGATELEEGDVTAAFATFTSWSPPTASWQYNSSGEPSGLSGVGGAISSGANSWNGVGGSPWSFSGGGSTGLSPNSCGIGGGDGQSVVGWTPSLGGDKLASTCTWFGAFASEFDIEFSAAWNWTIGSPVETDLRTVAIHEFGHALGLLHTFDPGNNGEGSCPGEIMCPSLASGTIMNGPQTDDINGVVSLYGGTPVTPAPTSTPFPTSTPIPPPPPAPTATDTPAGGAVPTDTPVSGGAAPPPPPEPTNPAPTAAPPPAAPTVEPEQRAFFLPGIARD